MTEHQVHHHHVQQRPPFCGPVDIAESADAFIFKCDVPGMTKKDIKVKILDGCLEISGTRTAEGVHRHVEFTRMERSQGTFCRRFKLPEQADVLGIAATCDHGVLTVSVPKKTREMPALTEIPIASASDEGDGSLNSEFEAVPLCDFPTPALGKIVILPSDCSVLEAVKILSSHRILAAPVQDMSQPADASWTDKYMGIVDMVAIVFFMLEKLQPEKPMDFQQEIEHVEAFKTTTVRDIAKTARFGPFIPVEFDRGNLLDCMLLCGQHHQRRVAVVKSPGGDLVNIITQSALVQTLHANLERFSAVGDKTLNQLGLSMPERVWKVRVDQPLMAAFTLIKEKDISAVPVVDEFGVIKGNISARDVRLIITSPKVYKLLHMPISVYLEVVSEGAENSAITCKPTDTLAEVISQLVASRIHRTYVVNSSGCPIRVVALADILKKFTKEPSGYFGHYFS